MLKAAGWNRFQFWRFHHWLYFNEKVFTTAKLRRLAATGGRPMPVLDDLRQNLEDARRSSEFGGALLLAVAFAAVVLAVLRRVRVTAALVAMAHVAWLLVVALGLQSWMRFPARIALPMAVIAAAAALAATRAGVLVEAWTGTNRRRTSVGLAVAGMSVAAWLIAEAWATRWTGGIDSACASDESRIAARAPTLVVLYTTTTCYRDPLRAQGRPYPSITLGWPIFSPLFYRGIARLGIDHGSDLARAMAAHPDAYVLLQPRHVSMVTRGFAMDLPGAELQEVESFGDAVLMRVVQGPAAAPAQDEQPPPEPRAAGDSSADPVGPP